MFLVNYCRSKQFANEVDAMSHGHTLQKLDMHTQLDLTSSGCVHRASNWNVLCNHHVLSWDDSNKKTLAYVNGITVD